jgi:hypothetical protein
MANLALSPSVDPVVKGGAQQLILLKTNAGTAASLDIELSAIVSASTSTTVTVAPARTAFASGAGSFSIGSAAFTYTSYTPATGVFAGVTPDPTSAATVGAVVQQAGYGSLSDLALAGTAGNSLYYQAVVSAGQVVITVGDLATGVAEVSQPLGGQTVMTIQVTAPGVSAAVMNITAAGLLTTIVTGTGAANLSIDTTKFATVGLLAQYIAAQPGYVTTTPSPTLALGPTGVMDTQASADIHTAPYAIVEDAYDVAQYFAKSTLIGFAPGATFGLPAAMPQTFFTGGTLGGTSAADIVNAFDALAGVSLNFVVPLFSQDATADIPLGVTDPSSTYTAAGVYAGLRSHIAQMITVKGRMERQGYCGIQGSYADDVALLSSYSYNRISYHIQQVDVLGADGLVHTKQPHALAVINASMKASAVVGLSNTFKNPNISAFSMLDSDFDPVQDADAAIYAGFTFVTKVPGANSTGFRFELDNSSYTASLDAWYNARPSVIYAGDIAAQSIRLNTEIFVGRRNSDVDEPTIANFVGSKVMDALLSNGIIVGDANSDGKGYMNLAVSILGNVIYISVTLVLVENFEFVLSNITVTRAVS